MNRRDFLKLGGLVSILLILPAEKIVEAAAPATEAEMNGKIYRGAPNGEIYVSEDQRQTWRKHTNFGLQYSVSQISSGPDGRLYAKMKFQRRTFYLSLSAHENFWRVG